MNRTWAINRQLWVVLGVVSAVIAVGAWMNRVPAAQAVRGGSSVEAVNYTIKILTGDRANAGTNSTIHLMLMGTNGSVSEVVNHSGDGEALSQGHVDTLEKQLNNVGDLLGVFLWNDDRGEGSGWLCDEIIVEGPGTRWTCPCGRWLAFGEDDNLIARWLPVDSRERR